MITRDFLEIDAAINEESWDWLQDCLPAMASAISKEVKLGADADEIRRHIFRRTLRPALAMRCSQAAGYLISNNGSK